MDKDQTKDSSIYVSTTSVAPEQPRNDGRNDETRERNELEVMPVLPPDDGILAQIAYICHTGLTTRLQNHPTNVRVPETHMRIIRVEVSVRVSMVGSVSSCPPLDGALHGTCTCQGKVILQW